MSLSLDITPALEEGVKFVVRNNKDKLLSQMKFANNKNYKIVALGLPGIQNQNHKPKHVHGQACDRIHPPGQQMRYQSSADHW